MPTISTDTCPYPGLRPFRPDETHLFFGRDNQVDSMLARLGEVRFLVVNGPSGCGKSSLVLAGLIPALSTGLLDPPGPDWRVVHMRPGDRPFNHLARALVASGAFGDVELDAVPLIEAGLRSGPLGLTQTIRDIPDHGNESTLLLVDQFEELFRFRRADGADEADAFVALLLATARQDDLPLYVVLTMRSEFVGECDVFQGMPEAINQGLFLIPRLNRSQRKLAIESPARVAGGHVEPDLVNRLLNDIGDESDQLPLMQHALMRLWRRAAAPGSPAVLNSADYARIGGVNQALSNHADEAYQQLSAAQKTFAEFMFRCLTERGPNGFETRRPAQLQEIAGVAGVSVAEAASVVEVFRSPDLSLLTPPAPVTLSPETVIDISHESLIRQWRRLKEWVSAEVESAANYRRIEQNARLWSESLAPLWQAPEITSAGWWRKSQKPNASWARRYGGDFELAMKFLDASLAEYSGKQKRDNRVSCIAAAVGFVIIIAALAYAVSWSIYLLKLFGPRA
jgi:hypothetical protein